MFLLGGVSGFLFRPLAEAFVFALIASYVLTYTLVPTLADFLLRGQAHGPVAGRTVFGRLQRRFENGFEDLHARLVRLR